MDTTTTTYNYLPTKKEIIERLFKAEHITFDEMWVLLQENENVTYIPVPFQPYVQPYNPWQPPYTYTSTSHNQ